jgi:hypothetical protein
VTRKKKAPPAPPAPLPDVLPEPNAPMVPKAKAPAVLPVTKCYVLRVWKDFDAGLRGMDFELELSGEFFPLAARLCIGDRLLLQAWEGGQATGKIRLVRVVGVHTNPPSPSIKEYGRVFVEQTWGFKKDAPAIDAFLKHLSLTVIPMDLPVLGAAVPEPSAPTEPCIEVLTPVTGASISDALRDLLGG